jgi:hypothetical protein
MLTKIDWLNLQIGKTATGSTEIGEVNLRPRRFAAMKILIDVNLPYHLFRLLELATKLCLLEQQKEVCGRDD